MFRWKAKLGIEGKSWQMVMMSQLRQRAFGIRFFGLILVAVLLSLLAASRWHSNESRSSVMLFEPQIQTIQSEPLGPRRDPAQDLRLFFPEATRYEVETVILSGRRTELTQRLGRQPTGDENALHVNRVYVGNGAVGAVLTRRVQGAYGGVELGFA